MRVNVMYLVQVMVTVDTRTKRVRRVRVLDEDVRRSDEETGYLDDEAGSAMLPRSHPFFRRAVTIAETEEWPGWECGL
jgi:hypothetical protein